MRHVFLDVFDSESYYECGDNSNPTPDLTRWVWFKNQQLYTVLFQTLYEVLASKGYHIWKLTVFVKNIADNNLARKLFPFYGVNFTVNFHIGLMAVIVETS